MKQLSPKTLEYIARTYGKKYAGDEANPSASEVSASDTPEESAPQAVADASPMDQAPASVDSLPLDQSASVDPAAGQAQAVVPDLPLSQSASVMPTAQSSAPPPPQQQPTAPANPYEQAGVPDIEQSLQEEGKAYQDYGKAMSGSAGAEAHALNQAQQIIAKLPSANDIAQGYKQKDDALESSYRENKIDPRRLYHNMNTGQKVASGIALFLGGIGSALTGQPNAAAQMIENAVNQDIDAQKNSQDQKLNLWKMNKEEFGNDLAANLATQNQMLLGVKYQLLAAGAHSQNAESQLRAAQGKAAIDQKIAQNRFQLSLMQPTSDSFGLDPAKKVAWLVPQSHQQKAFDEIDAAQNATQNSQGIMKAFDDASGDARPLNAIMKGQLFSPSSMNPWTDTPSQKQLHALLGPTFKDVEGTVRQAAMDNLFKNTTPQFGDNQATIDKKRVALEGYLKSKSAAPVNSGFGINLSQYPSTNVSAAIPPRPGQRPQQPVVQKRNGVSYQQVPGGWKKIQ